MRRDKCMYRNWYDELTSEDVELVHYELTLKDVRDLLGMIFYDFAMSRLCPENKGFKMFVSFLVTSRFHVDISSSRINLL